MARRLRWVCQETRRLDDTTQTIMKKNRTSRPAHHPEHAGLINYLALMHAITHPEPVDVGH